MESDKKETIKSNKDDIPISTPSRIIIQSREQSYTFDKDTYRDEYLRHCIAKYEYDAIVEGASKIMGQSWSKKRLNDQIKLPRFVIVLAVVSVLLTIIYMVLLYLSTTYDDGTSLLVVSIICVTAGSVIAFGLSIYNFCRKIGRFKSLEEIIKEDLDIYFIGVNKKYDSSLRLIFNASKRWIECHILKANERGDREEKRSFINEEVQEEPENENVEFEEEVANKKYSAKHSRAQSSISRRVIHSRVSSMANANSHANKLNPSHSRAQSNLTSMKRDNVNMIELKDIDKKDD